MENTLNVPTVCVAHGKAEVSQFGFRNMGIFNKIIPQSWCRDCRSGDKDDD